MWRMFDYPQVIRREECLILRTPVVFVRTSSWLMLKLDGKERREMETKDLFG